MADTVFRNQSTATTAQPPKVESKNDAQATPNSGVEVPFNDYEMEHGHPYLVDHFQLGDTWNDAVGGFPKEITTINSYIEGKIKNGDIANSVTAIRSLIRGMEKMNNLTQEERTVVKIETLSNYVEFLMKNDALKGNLRRYAH